MPHKGHEGEDITKRWRSGI